MQIGDKAIYYPAKKNELDNRHPEVEIIGLTPTKQVRIKWTDTDGSHKATVSQKRLEFGQPSLI